MDYKQFHKSGYKGQYYTDPSAKLSTEWMRQANCRGLDAEIFFPMQGGSKQKLDAKAKSFCRECPVRLECLDYAVSTHTNIGIWGGLNAEERRLYKRQIKGK